MARRGESGDWSGPTKLRASRVMDLYHRLVTRPWWMLMVLVGCAYLTVNLLFGLAYALAGGISGARSGHFGDAFFFSVQTLSTIGYGAMAPETPAAYLLVTLESLAGLLGLALVAGLVFAKFSLPISRVVFSDVACLTIHDGRPALLIRMANARRNYIVEAQLRATLLDDYRTTEGHDMRRMVDLELVRSSSPFFYLSWLAVHVIDESSPLWGCGGESLAAKNTQLAVSLVGLDESLSQTIHARKLYDSDYLLWGRRYVDIVERLPDGRVRIDNRRLSETEGAPAPEWR